MALTLNGLTVVEMTLTKAWGITPASASIRGVGEAVATGSDVALNIGASVFYGVVASSETKEEDQGTFQYLEVVDNRIKLNWDTVYGCFNMVEVIEDDPATPGIDRKKRYWHIYPEDWHAQGRTITDEPLTAGQILAELLAADTVQHSWSAGSHDKFANPILAFDANTGKKLSNCVQELCDKLGLQVSISGSSSLLFSVKGEGTVPAPDSASSRDRSDGDALGAETKVRVVGDRNLYQDLPITLEPDWNDHFESYWFQPEWVARVKSLLGITDDAEAEARARELTLREYCNLTSNTNADRGIWGEVSRMEIPVWVYITDIVWKAYRLPRNYTVNGIKLDSLELREELIAAVDMNTSGSMDYKSPREYYPDAKAAVLVQGQPLSFLDPTSEGAINIEKLASLRNAWQPNNRFRLDTRNKTILFEEATFIPGAGSSALYVNPNEGIDGAPQDIAVPNAGFSASPANVRASLAFEAERYSKWYGSGERQGSSYVSGLNYHILLSGGSWQEEATYADNDSADTKAAAAAAAFLTNQPYIQSGGFRRIGQAGMALNGTISRITTQVAFTGGGEGDGISETVEYSRERAGGSFDNETELARRQQTRDLFPGQSDLKEAARQLRLISRLTKDAKRQVQRPIENVDDFTRKLPGNIHCSPAFAVWGDAGTTAAGRPVFGNGLTASLSGSRFLGVIACANQGALTGGKVLLATQGVLPMRVKCRLDDQGSAVAIKPGDLLVGDPAFDYAMVKEKEEDPDSSGESGSGGSSGEFNGTRVIAVAEEGYEGTEIPVIRVRLAAGGATVKSTELGGFQEYWKNDNTGEPTEAEQKKAKENYLNAGVLAPTAATSSSGDGSG